MITIIHQKLDLFKYKYKCSKQLSLKITNMHMTKSLLHQHHLSHIKTFKVCENLADDQNIEIIRNL